MYMYMHVVCLVPMLQHDHKGDNMNLSNHVVNLVWSDTRLLACSCKMGRCHAAALLFVTGRT